MNARPSADVVAVVNKGAPGGLPHQATLDVEAARAGIRVVLAETFETARNRLVQAGIFKVVRGGTP